MEETTPLFLIALAITGTWVIGKIVTRSYRGISRKVKQKNRGTKIAEGLYVVNLSDTNLERLVSLIKENDELKLTYFITKYRPNIIQIEEYLDELRVQYRKLFHKGIEFASDKDKSDALGSLSFATQPKILKINSLSHADLQSLINHNSVKKRYITRSFMQKFGNKSFMENYQVYEKIRGALPVTLHITKDHEHRSAAESLVESGMAMQGRKIHLRDRLNVLQFHQLKNMAKELKIDKKFKSRADAADTMAEIPGSAVLLAMIYAVDDIFLIKPEEIDSYAVDAEWACMQAYARILLKSLDENTLSVLII